MKAILKGVIALSAISIQAKAATIEDLHMVSETGVSVEEFQRLNSNGIHVMGLHAADYPDSLHAGDYPNSLHAADYPDSLHAGDYPASYHAADYPDSLGKDDGTAALPSPVLDF